MTPTNPTQAEEALVERMVRKRDRVHPPNRHSGLPIMLKITFGDLEELIAALAPSEPHGEVIQADELVKRLRGHALGLRDNGRYDPAKPSGLTNADAVSYGNLIGEAADRLASTATLQRKLDMASLDIMDAGWRLENKITNATGALADTGWRPTRSVVEGMRNTMQEALDLIATARTTLDALKEGTRG